MGLSSKYHPCPTFRKLAHKVAHRVAQGTIFASRCLEFCAPQRYNSLDDTNTTVTGKEAICRSRESLPRLDVNHKAFAPFSAIEALSRLAEPSTSMASDEDPTRPTLTKCSEHATQLIPVETRRQGYSEEPETLDFTHESADVKEEETDSLDERTDMFDPIIKALNLHELAVVALRKRRDMHYLASSRESDELYELTCEVLQPPRAGGFNMIYIIRFSDGVKWVARIPGKATNFKHNDVVMMNQTYGTMRLVRATTPIPVPEVFHWETNRTTGVGVPYALISFVDGVSLSDVWFDTSEEKKLQILSNVATCMSNLSTLEFALIGGLDYDETTQTISVREFCKYQSDFYSELPWDRTIAQGPWRSQQQQERDTWPRYKRKPCTWQDVSTNILHMAARSMPNFLKGGSKTYLQHPDFDLQNIFIDDQGIITGLIDWDSVHTDSCTRGYGRYPSWITRDWNPSDYNYFEDEDSACGFFPESSPQKLSQYRKHYADTFAQFKIHDYNPRQTQFSHIVEAIDLAMRNPLSRNKIILKILDHAFGGQMPFTYTDFVNARLMGNAKDMLKQIKTAFDGMWHAEWELN